MANPYEIAANLMPVVKEIPGEKHDPWILHSHRTCSMRATTDEVPWCAAMVNAICLELGLPRTNSAAARSWLNVGTEIPLESASKGFDIVILERGSGGHVGFYDSHDEDTVYLLGGNQSNEINVSRFLRSRIMGVRRLYGQL